MTSEEAIENLIDAYQNGCLPSKEAFEMAIEALEKQIPMPMMEVLDISGRPIRVCGNCEDAPGNGEFCKWCGQRIKR